MLSGFLSEDHKENFQLAGRRVGNGGPDASQCGARTALGAHEKNRHRKPECDVLGTLGHIMRGCIGSVNCEISPWAISFDEWHRAEIKRAANRLQDQWKKNPWHPGQTIDLAGYELDFVDALQTYSLNPDALPPAVVDWLRWKYRRYRIDQDKSQAWTYIIHRDLKARLSKAGPRPASTSGDLIDNMISAVGPA